MAIDQSKLEEFIGRFAVDFGAAMHAATVVIGDKLGLYKSLAAAGPIDAAGLAARTGYDRRLVEEWLCAQFVSGYCEHDPEAGSFWLTEEQAAALADESSPALLVGAMTGGGRVAHRERQPGGPHLLLGVAAHLHPLGTGPDGGYALGNQVPDSVWRDLLAEAGFTRFRRATETPFNRVFEVRP